MKTLTKGEWLHDVDLKSLNTWRIGGKAERFYWPHDLEDLQRFLKTLPPEEPITWLGLGSNVLIRDGGIRGTVILTQGALRELKLLDHGLVRAEAGVASSQVARFAARSGLVGAEFLAGIPGSVGGALVMNAGACGGETWRHVHHVETIDRQGNIHKRYPSDFRIAYRTAEGLRDGEGFVAAIFKFDEGDSDSALEKIRDLLNHRSDTQPINLPCCGCVFRNPEGGHAAKMIDELGLKGTRVGGLQISEKHANFFINTGDATSEDAESIIKMVQEKVRQHFGVDLHPEVKFIGEKLS